jgi:hypothetical protein
VNQLSHFEENLLAELREVVAERAVPPRPARPRRRLVLATAGAGLVAAGLVLGLPAMNSDRTAAHAITSNDDGTLTITVNRLEDPEGLERDLAAHGITADVSFAPPGKMCRPFPERFQRQADEVHEVFLGVNRGDDPLVVYPDDLAGKTLVIEGSISEGTTVQDEVFIFSQYAVAGPVGPCVLVG